MKRIKTVLIFFYISSCFYLFGEVRYYSIDSLPGLYAVDLDSNKTVFTGRTQYRYPYDSQKTSYDSSFNADFVFSFGNLDPSCGGQTFLTYFSSYQVSDIENIDTLKLIRRPRLDSMFNEFGPFYEINSFYSNPILGQDDYINKYYLVKTNETNFAVLRINALLSNFDTYLLCNKAHAAKIEWWVQNDGKYDQLNQIVKIAFPKANKNVYNLNENYNKQYIYNFLGKKCSNNTLGILIVRENNKIYKKINVEKECRLKIH